MNSWWETPLCSKFINEITDEIHGGNIVLVFIPKHAHKNFLSQFKVVFDRNRNLLFDKINLKECDISDSKPVESLLFTLFEIDDNTNTFIPKNAASIFRYLEDIKEKSHIEDNRSIDFFVFENVTNTILEHFRNFIIDLGHHLSSLPVYNRPKIMAIIDPEKFSNSDFTSETGISKILFQGVFDKLDLSLGLRYYHEYQADVFTALNESIIVSLALFDSELADELTDCDNLMKQYPEILINYATVRKWNEIKYISENNLTPDEIWKRWSIGILEIKNDKPVYHSAFLKAHNKEKELTKRIWTSGIEILMPLIEEFRGKILKSDKILFPKHFKNTKNGDIKTKMDLEIGNIYHYVNTREINLKYFSQPEREKLKIYIKTSWSIRNDLSHLRMPTGDNIKQFLKEYDNIIQLLNNNI